jgi:hypothetical protein
VPGSARVGGAAITREADPSEGSASERPASRRPVGGPTSRAWREGTLTRAKELESLCDWAALRCPRPEADSLLPAVAVHLQAARDAACPRRWSPRDTASLERAISNLDAAEALLLTVAPPDYLLGRLPGVVNGVVLHLPPTDHRRQELERLAARVRVCTPDPGTAEPQSPSPTVAHRRALVDDERLTIATASRAAGSAALREQLRLRSFRTVLTVATGLLIVLAATLALIGIQSPTAIPMCFQPEEAGQTVVVCPTAQAAVVETGEQQEAAFEDVDDTVRRTAGRWDILLVELVGLAAGAVAAATAIRGIRGSSEPHGIPVALAVLKLPTAAITAVLGLLLMRGQFFPGLTALDTSAQILAWALVFGYAQQLFTRLVDQQAHTVLDTVRDRTEPSPGSAVRAVP